MSTFPVNPQIVKKDAKHAAEKKHADEHMKWFDKPKVVTVQQLKAHKLKREAHELEDAIYHMRQNSGLDPDVARRSEAEVKNAIAAANIAMDHVNQKLSKKWLTKATKSFRRAESMLGKPMTIGGTLRRKHRKSVKRCKS
jgi:hypothetical protein